MFNIVQDTPGTLQIIDMAMDVAEAWRKLHLHATLLILGSVGVEFNTRKLADGLAITNEVGEQVGRIIMEPNYGMFSSSRRTV